MRWEQGRAAVDGMVARGELERVPASREHADALLEQARQHLGSAAAIAGTDPVGAYQLLYDGARKALVERGGSLLPAGVVGVEGSFAAEDAVEVAGADGKVFAKGLAAHPAARIKEWQGRRTSDLPADLPHEVVHRDDLVVLPG